MLRACVDIGSNTTRLLVAEVSAAGALRPVLERRAFTRLGRGLRERGEVVPEKVAEVAAVVAEQVALAGRAGAALPRVVATAAVRAAANGEALCAAVGAAAGTPVEVLDPEEEARLAFLGATRTLGRALTGTVAVVDVGGGSSEIAVGTVAAGVAWSASFEVGSGSLAEAHLHGDPPARAELDAVARAAQAALAGHPVPPCGCAVAVGGSATSLRRLAGPVLDADALSAAVTVLARAPCAEVARAYDLDPERVRLLPAGLLVLAAAARVLGRPLEVGRGGLREGICLQAAIG